MTQRHLIFEANNPETNLFRWYSLRIGQDFFGDVFIQTEWGRKGQRQGQSKEYVFTSHESAYKQALTICRKRLNSSKRIGCNYVCTSRNLTLEMLQAHTLSGLTAFCMGE